MAVIRNSKVVILQGFCYCGSLNPDQSYLTTIREDGHWRVSLWGILRVSIHGNCIKNSVHSSPFHSSPVQSSPVQSTESRCPFGAKEMNCCNREDREATLLS